MLDFTESEPTADENDRASSISERLLADAEAKVRALAQQDEFHEDFDGKHCVECDALIPEIRRRPVAQGGHGKVRCCDCQTAIETRKKFFAASS
jgi:RNA polymerase-binding transcription factor DksA